MQIVIDIPDRMYTTICGRDECECNPLESYIRNGTPLEQEPILDKIRAEIVEEKEHAYADFERYKVEYLGQDWEDALDSLPQDDFRYGMERAIEIIDKSRQNRGDNCK